MRNLNIQIDSNKKNMLNTLTSFRFFAAMLVFIFHAGYWSNYGTGYLGVSFFFILSGFILTYNYHSKLTKLNRLEIRKFYIARFSKIYPVHLLTFLLAIPDYFFIPLQHKPILYFFQGITNVLLIHSFIPFGNFSFNGVSWSLSDEGFFYILFPFIIFFTFKYLKTNSVRFVYIGSMWIILIITFSYFLPIKNNFSQWFAYVFPGVRMFEFIVGVTLGTIFIRVRESYKRFSNLFFSVTELIVILIMVLIIFISPNLNQNLRYSLLFLPFWSLIIFVFSFQRGILSSFLNQKIFVYLGEISFSFYMIHNLVFSYIYFLWKPKVAPFITISVCLIISILLSSLMFHFYEEPMRIKLKKHLNNFSLKSLSNILFSNRKDKSLNNVPLNK